MVTNNFVSVLLVLICLYSLEVQAVTQGGQNPMKKAIEFMAKADKTLNTLTTAATHASWKWSVNITKHNLKIKEKAVEAVKAYSKKMNAQAKKFPWKSFKLRNSTLYRWFELAVNGLGIGESPGQNYFIHRMAQQGGKQSKNMTQQQDGNKTDEDPYPKMMEIFGKVQICPPGESKKNCNIDITSAFGTSRDPKELKHYWKEFRKQTGEKYRNLFLQAIKKDNKDVAEFGYKNKALYNIALYEDNNFVQNIADEMKKILPLYKQIHAYVRKKLMKYYKSENIQKEGPIPAHLLGDHYAQRWSPISDIVMPYPKSSGCPNVTKAMLEKKMKPIDMFIMAEKFFESIGLEKMTPYFWHYSLITKPVGRDVDCHASATSFSDGKDYRIKMCTIVEAGNLEVVHHEMGHIEYFMHFRHLPYLFQDSANPGFHEASGDVISLSVQTPSYMKQVGLLKSNETGRSTESTINYLMSMALTYFVTVPYAYIIDFWRNQVYEGKIKESELNKKYWQYRLEYQGVCPPEKRTEQNFDIGAKYHIASGVEYFRYYVANIMQFTIHKILCKEAGHQRPLHECNIYKNKKAGKLFAKLLSAGRSKNWKQLLRLFSNGAYTKLDATPMLEYFKPLMDWLKRQNANETKGWKSDDPMVCPGSSSGTGSGTTPGSSAGTKGTTVSISTQAVANTTDSGSTQAVANTSDSGSTQANANTTDSSSTQAVGNTTDSGSTQAVGYTTVSGSTQAVANTTDSGSTQAVANTTDSGITQAVSNGTTNSS